MRLVCQPSKVSTDHSIITHLTILYDYPALQKISLHIQREVVHVMLGSAEVLLAIFEKYSDLKMLDKCGSSVENVGAQITTAWTIYAFVGWNKVAKIFSSQMQGGGLKAQQ